MGLDKVLDSGLGGNTREQKDALESYLPRVVHKKVNNVYEGDCHPTLLVTATKRLLPADFTFEANSHGNLAEVVATVRECFVRS